MNNFRFKRIFLVIIDSVGCGAASDSMDFNDEPSVNTIGNLCDKFNMKLSNLEKMGLGNISDFSSIKKVDDQIAYSTKMIPLANGKDSIAGHWEMMGATLNESFQTYITDDGLPKDLLDKVSKYAKRELLWCKNGSGMNLINEFADEAKRDNKLIIYTSPDSTFQIAADESHIPVAELIDICKYAFSIITAENSPWKIARVIARPFIKDNNGIYSRTGNRADYAVKPFKKTALETLHDNGVYVNTIGKVSSLFSDIGVSNTIHTNNNQEGIEAIKDQIDNFDKGLVFANLVDFDSVYGHPRDPEGYKNALIEFDNALPSWIESLNDDDLLIITADHGNDPTYKGNDHTRENVPLIIYNNKFIANKRLSDIIGYNNLGQTICDNFELKHDEGKSFLSLLK